MTQYQRQSGRDAGDLPHLALTRAVFAAAVAEKPARRFMICSRTRMVQRHPVGDW